MKEKYCRQKYLLETKYGDIRLKVKPISRHPVPDYHRNQLLPSWQGAYLEQQMLLTSVHPQSFR